MVAGITPFNFPAMIPLWQCAPAIACGNAFILKPSERDPGVPIMLAELMMEAGLPPGILNVVNGDKDAVDAILDHPDISRRRLRRLDAGCPIYLRARLRSGKRMQCFGGAKNHMIVMPDADMDQAVDALIGAGYGSARRALHGGVGGGAGRQGCRRVPRREARFRASRSLKIGPSTSADADFGPLVTAAHLKRVKDYVAIGIEEGAKLARRRPRLSSMQGYENGFYMGGCLFDHVEAGHAHLQGRDLWPGAVRGARQDLRGEPTSSPTTTNTATALPSSPATAMRRATSPPRSTSAWLASTCRSRCRLPTTPSAAGSARPSAI